MAMSELIWGEMFSIKERRVLVVRRHLWGRLDAVEG